jgi:hypothetical protein
MRIQLHDDSCGVMALSNRRAPGSSASPFALSSHGREAGSNKVDINLIRPVPTTTREA